MIGGEEMAVSEDIRTIRDQVLADLTAAHDYCTDTKTAWRIVRKVIAAGRAITIRNKITGTVTTQAELAVKASGYVSEQLTEATFQQFISLFENFYFDLLRLWLTAYPQSLSKKTVDFQTILELPDKDAITGLVVRKELSEFLYDRPAAWFAYLEKKAKLGCPTANEIDRIAEAKASRDVLVHNKGVVNKIYESKAGHLARFHEGEGIDVSERYHREIWELIRKIVSDISNAAIAKTSWLSPVPATGYSLNFSGLVLGGRVRRAWVFDPGSAIWRDSNRAYRLFDSPSSAP